jgi:microcystin-dependent protein
MLIYGDLIAAGLEELESDPTTSLFSGRVYRNTTTGEIKMYTGTLWKTVLDKDTTQTLSGKTIDSSCTVSSSASLPVVPPSKGGTGVANADAATLTRSGSHALTLGTTGTTSVTLPTTGTLATLSGAESLVNKVVASTSLTTGGLKLPTGNSTTERPAGTVADLKGMIRYNDTDDVFEGYNELGGWSSIGGGGTTDRITQASHGFVVGDVLYLNGAVYTKAIASAANTAEVVGVVSKIIDTSQFELTLSGEVSGLLASSFTEGSLPSVGEAVFLSGSVAGKLTITEPTVVGHVSLPVGVVSEAIASPAGRKLYVAIKRGAVVGGANARTQIPLANAATSTVQNVSAYEAGELTGWVSIQATSPLKFYVSVKFSKNGAGTDYNLSYQVSGDTPPVGFSISVTSVGVIQATLPSVAGFGSASINYSLNAPAVGVTLPLSISSTQVVGDTNPVGTLLDYAGTTAPSGYLMCDGRSLSTAGTYAALFAVLGYAYGGSGSSFNVPDFRGKFTRYLDNMGGTAANIDTGRVMGTAQTDAMQGHHHSGSTGGSNAGRMRFRTPAGFSASTDDSNYMILSTSSPSGFAAPVQEAHTHTVATNAYTVDGANGTPRTAVETRPVNVVCTKIIKF